MKKLIIMFFVVAGGYGKMMAQAPAVVMSDKTGWHHIATRTVDFKTDRDEITVMGADKFASLKFKVKDAAIDLRDLQVYYEDGTKQDVNVASVLNMGAESRVIDLNGKEKALKKIIFVYRTAPNRKDEKAEVEVWGLKTNWDKEHANAANGTQSTDVANTGVPKPAIVMSDKTGWHKIGEVTADFKADKDELMVMGADRFSSIRFKVTDAPIEIRNITIYYADNTTQKIDLIMPLKAAEEGRVIDLTGGERDLKKIVFNYKTVPNSQSDKAHVEVWGLKTNTKM